MSDCCCLACQNNGNTHITNEKSCHRRLTLSEYLAIGVGFQIIFHLGFLMGARVIKRKSLNLRVTFLRLLLCTDTHAHTRYNCVIYIFALDLHSTHTSSVYTYISWRGAFFFLLSCDDDCDGCVLFVSAAADIPPSYH